MIELETPNDGEGDESFSPAEKEFFESGGVKTDGVVAGADAGDAGAAKPVDPAAGQQANPDGAQKTPEGKDRFVPYDAFHNERERRKGVENELRQLNDRWTRTEERQKQLNELLGVDKPAGQQVEQPIDPEKDIFGAFKQALTKISSLEQQISGTSQKFEQQTADQRLLSSYQEDARQFMAKEPAFVPAYSYLLNMRNQELEVMGEADPAKRNAIIAAEERAIVAQAAARRVSPAEIVFALAKARGFTSQQKQVEQKSDAEKQLDTIEKGKAASQSFGGAGGVSPEGLTAAKVADMSEDEFAETFAKLSKADQRKLMGG